MTKTLKQNGLHGTGSGRADDHSVGGVLLQDPVRVAPEGASANSAILAEAALGHAAGGHPPARWRRSVGNVLAGAGPDAVADSGQSGHPRQVRGPVRGLYGAGPEVRRRVQPDAGHEPVPGGQQSGADPGGAEPERALLWRTAGFFAVPQAVWRGSE